MEGGFQYCGTFLRPFSLAGKRNKIVHLLPRLHGSRQGGGIGEISVYLLCLHSDKGVSCKGEDSMLSVRNRQITLSIPQLRYPVYCELPAFK